MLNSSFEYYCIWCIKIPGIYNFFSLKQLNSCLTRISRSNSREIDHILVNNPVRVSQKGVIDIGLSDHQLLFCIRILC